MMSCEIIVLGTAHLSHRMFLKELIWMSKYKLKSQKSKYVQVSCRIIIVAVYEIIKLK